MNRNVLTSFTILCVLSTVFLMGLVFNIRTVKASGTIYIKTGGSVDPPTANITSADNVTYTFTGNINDSIVVERSNIIIDGNEYTLQGSGSGSGFLLSHINNVTIQNTNINGFGYGAQLNSAPHSVLSRNNITNNGRGVLVNKSPNCTIYGNNVTDNDGGILLDESSNCTVCGNTVTNNDDGISVQRTSNSIISENIVEGNGRGFYVFGYTIGHWTHSIDVSNLVNGKPIYYLVNQKDLVITPTTYPEIGYLALINCTNIKVEGLTLNADTYLPLVNTNNTKIIRNNMLNGGILLTAFARAHEVLSRPSNNEIYANNITNGGINLKGSINTTISRNDIEGIFITWDTSNTIISGNSIVRRDITIEDPAENTVVYENTFINSTHGLKHVSYGSAVAYHNNFINSTYKPMVMYGHVTWDNGYPSGGNYWSDYNGTDLDGDGIGDTPYIINVNNQDRYPLMSPWTPPEHELVMSITAPTFIRLDSSSSLEATATNEGLSDEVNVELEILINGTTADSTTIPLLQASHSYTLSYQWTPTAEGTYNVTAYAHPVSGETSTENNQKTAFTTVAEIPVGVKAGDWIKCDYSVTGWPSGTPYPEWLKVEILIIEGTTATVNVTMHMSDGTEQSDTVSVDVVAGGGTFDTLFGFVIAANSKVGDSIKMGGDGYTFTVTIDGETTRTYAGASRTVVYASFSQYGTELTYYWDKQTGIMVEASGTSSGMTMTAKATETNMWEPTPFWMQWWLWAIVAVVIVALAGAVYIIKRRKAPTTPIPSPENTDQSK